MLVTLPDNLYSTIRGFGDLAADDMRCGDMPESRLKSQFNLINVSNIVEPYKLSRLTAFNNPQSRFSGIFGDKKGGVLSVEECAELLFEEMQITSLPFSFYGKYKKIIHAIIGHLHSSTGKSFRSHALNEAYRNQIVNDKSYKSTLVTIQQNLDAQIKNIRKGLTFESVYNITQEIRDRVLPKFDSLILDKINGLGISVHDVHATKIDLINLEFSGSTWRALIKYTAQDHFGLDINDIKKIKFRQFQFFKIWFVLQRYERFGFRPFLTDIEATVAIHGRLS